MADLRMGPAETQFAEMIWANEPITSGALSKKAEEALSWKKTTSFTVLKRLCDRGLFALTEGTVTALVSREEFYERQSREYVQTAFDGSLPAFVAAFSRSRKLAPEEIAALQRLIDESRR